MVTDWKIDQQKRTMELHGIVFKMDRNGGRWVCKCLNPSLLSSYIGEGEASGRTLSRLVDHAIETWEALIKAGHSRNKCPHLARKHTWSGCPANHEVKEVVR